MIVALLAPHLTHRLLPFPPSGGCGILQQALSMGRLQQVVQPAQTSAVTGFHETLLPRKVRNQQFVHQVHKVGTGIPACQSLLLLEAVDQRNEDLQFLHARTDTVVAIASATMGDGSEELGKTLLKAFVFALTQQDKLPKTILFYNGGAALSCEGSAMLEDLKALEAQGVEILTCGTCLNFYGLTEKLAVGSVTNMYTIAEKLTQAGNVVKP